MTIIKRLLSIIIDIILGGVDDEEIIYTYNDFNIKDLD